MVEFIYNANYILFKPVISEIYYQKVSIANINENIHENSRKMTIIVTKKFLLIVTYVKTYCFPLNIRYKYYHNIDFFGVQL